MTESLPLVASDQQADRPLFLTIDGPVSRAGFLAQAATLSQTLPATQHVFNLCNDRYLFALAFAATLMRGRVSLFPPNRLAATCQEIARDYPGAVVLTDTEIPGLELPAHEITSALGPVGRPRSVPQIPADQLAFVAFTSGTTGHPKPQPKHWGDLVGCARAAARRFGFGPGFSAVATVPPQHMYGLELSILVPFTTGCSVVASRPFFPADIRDALARAPARRILVTTPLHLDACVAADLVWPSVDLVISATAPLTQGLASRVEALLDTRVCEIYGSTETGSVASRETCRDPLWQWYDSVRPELEAETVTVSADFIRGRVPLADVLELTADNRFRILGRIDDMIKVAGRRASLGDLNLKLNAIDGVHEGIFVASEPESSLVGRLAVIAAAPGLDRAAIIAGLAGRIDPVFYPRRILFVDRLPRTDSGKIPRAELLRLLRDCNGAGEDAD
jgi:acyl-coenzyme A synthetase/AMP-(fatty) acid ligase